MTMYVSTAANKTISDVHPILAVIAADAAAGLQHILAAELDDGGSGLKDMRTVALWLHTKRHAAAM
jgi:hypothetical protein